MIKLTKTAGQHFINMLQNNSNVIGIYVGVKKSGCSGLSYVLDLANQDQQSSCKSYTVDKVQLFINNEHLQYLENITIDYITDQFGGHIKFINPNATGECGCGESFTVQ